MGKITTSNRVAAKLWPFPGSCCLGTAETYLGLQLERLFPCSPCPLIGYPLGLPNTKGVGKYPSDSKYFSDFFQILKYLWLEMH